MNNGAGDDTFNVVNFKAVRPPLAARAKPANDNENSPEPRQEKTVTMRKTLDKSGVTIKVKVPVSEFYGVAVSTRINEEGVLSSAIELVHHDEELNYKVFEEVGNTDVVAEWQNWGRKLRLPLFIRTGDGELMAYSQQVDGVMLGNSNIRRKTVNDASRRPRFLNRRKTGMAIVK